jgi:hypothetical protein
MSHPATHRLHCQNCGAPLGGPYCSKCGQHDVDYHRSFGHVLEDALEGVLHFDGKFFGSARYIFTRPGFLTTEFNAGRRTRYANPIRVYFFASFLLFAVSVLLEPSRSGEAARAGAPARAGAAQKAPGSGAGQPMVSVDELLAETRSPTPPPKAGTTAGTPAPDAAKDEGEGWTRFGVNGSTRLSTRELGREISHFVPTALFFCLPFLALVLKLVYIRSGRLYVEHLIFALHVQALAFLSIVVIRVVAALGRLAHVGAGEATATVLSLGMSFLIFRAFQNVYGQSLGRTLVKFALVCGAYAAILLAAILAVAVLSAYLLARSA